MAIIGRPQIKEAPSSVTAQDTSNAEDAFIGGAPDAKAPLRKEKQKKRQRKCARISLYVPVEVLKQFDEIARNIGITRSTALNISIEHLLKNGFEYNDNYIISNYDDGVKKVISVTISECSLSDLDRLSDKLRISRNSLLLISVYNTVKNGISSSGL